MPEIGVGIVGGGYMGKANAVAMAAAGAVFRTKLRPKLEMVCATSQAIGGALQGRIRVRQGDGRLAQLGERCGRGRSRYRVSSDIPSRYCGSRICTERARLLRKAPGRFARRQEV